MGNRAYGMLLCPQLALAAFWEWDKGIGRSMQMTGLEVALG